MNVEILQRTTQDGASTLISHRNKRTSEERGIAYEIFDETDGPFEEVSGAHRMISEHIAAECARLVESGANKVVEWSPNVNRPDNHFFDCVVGCFVAASTLGLLTSDDPRRK